MSYNLFLPNSSIITRNAKFTDGVYDISGNVSTFSDHTFDAACERVSGRRRLS